VISRSRLAALIPTALIAIVLCPQTAAAAGGSSFVATKGTVSIAFNAGVLASFQALGIEFNSGTGHAVAPSAAYPRLSIVPAAAQPLHAPRTPLNTARPAGVVYIGEATVSFYQQLSASNTQGGIEFPEVVFGAHPALEGEYVYTHTGANEVSGNTLSPLFLLNTRHIRPVLRGNTLTLSKIPMTLAPAALPFFSLFGPGFTSGEPVGTLTIKAER